MFVKRFLAATAATVGFFIAGHASALTFSVEPLDNSKAAILVSGVFEPTQDLSEFVLLAKTLGGKFGIVVFNSPGGNPSKAIEMGRLIRLLRLSTFQFRGMECSSACALAFMGGITRAAETGSIGVHKSSFSEGTAISVDDAVSYIQHQTAQTISYMTEMGIDPGLLQLSFSYEKDDMRYLSKSEMAQYKLTNLDLDTSSPSVQASAPSTPPTGTEARALPDYRIASDDQRFQIPLAQTGALRVPKGKEYLRQAEDQKSEKLLPLKNGQRVEIVSVGERWYRVRVKGKEGYLHHNWVRVDQFLDQPFENRFIQIRSFDNYSDAAAYVQSSDLPVTAYLATNKWYAVALTRTLPPKSAIELLNGLKAQGAVPDDAFMTVGNTYVRSVCCSN
ncbi:SH3 domain-containing protein [uncultured Agrobacterium sp.]|uniref:SH3 domain-containing protein n=1 Tax=uncultured Agrobacterium sp. TaxID=157277 RepID=UPI0025F79DEB|nr:SH3 domain-containing protein [uncultured Agrobacterium sp.]